MNYLDHRGNKLLDFKYLERSWLELFPDDLEPKSKIADETFINEARKILLKIYPPFIQELKVIEYNLIEEPDNMKFIFWLHHIFGTKWNVRIVHEPKIENEVKWDIFLNTTLPAAYTYDPFIFYYENRFVLNPDYKLEELKYLDIYQHSNNLIQVEIDIGRHDEEIIRDIKILIDRARKSSNYNKRTKESHFNNNFTPQYEDFYLVKYYWEGKTNKEILELTKKYSSNDVVSNRIAQVHEFINGPNKIWPELKKSLGKIRQKNKSDEFKKYFNFKYD